MRWPSVYAWGWIMVPGVFAILFGSVAIAAFVAGNLPSIPHLFPWVMGISFIGLGAVSMVLLACPRCGRNAYQRSGWFSNTMWPVSKCSRCGLDLRKFSPLDRRAKIEP